jgi:excisionase family DNA binding protein
MEALLTRQEMAGLLRCSLASLHRMMRHEGLPVLKVGGKTLFRWADVEDWLRSRTRQASATLSPATVRQWLATIARWLNEVTLASFPESLPTSADHWTLITEEVGDAKCPKLCLLWHNLSPEKFAQVSTILEAHGIGFCRIVLPQAGQDAEGRDLFAVIEMKEVEWDQTRARAQAQAYAEFLSGQGVTMEAEANKVEEKGEKPSRGGRPSWRQRDAGEKDISMNRLGEGS